MRVCRSVYKKNFKTLLKTLSMCTYLEMTRKKKRKPEKDVYLN